MGRSDEDQSTDPRWVGIDWGLGASFSALLVATEVATRQWEVFRTVMNYKHGKWQREASKRYPGIYINGSGRYGVIESRGGSVHSIALFRTASQTRALVEMLRVVDFQPGPKRTFEFEDFGDPLISALEERFEEAA